MLDRFAGACDCVWSVRIIVDDCADCSERVVFCWKNFEFIVFGEMLSERVCIVVLLAALISPMYGGGFELNELRRRRYNDDTLLAVPFGTIAVLLLLLLL